MDSVTIRLRKVMRNPLLGRRQAVVECIHPNKANVSKKDAAAKIAKMLKVSDLNTIFMFGFRTGFGGGKSKGFVLIYDIVETAKKFEPKYRLVRNGLLEAVENPRNKELRKRTETRNSVVLEFVLLKEKRNARNKLAKYDLLNSCILVCRMLFAQNLYFASTRVLSRVTLIYKVLRIFFFTLSYIYTYQ